jgi:acyl-CoA thioesterase
MEEGQGLDLEALKARLQDDPFARYLGIWVRDISLGSSKMEMEVRPEMVNFLDRVHGGAIFSLADHAFAAACNSHGLSAVALHLDITYLSAPTPGTMLQAEAREIHRGQRTATYLIEVSTVDGSLVAVCQGIAYRRAAGHEIPTRPNRS